MELSRDFHAVMCLRHTGEKQHTDVPDHPGLRIRGISTRGGAPGNLVFHGAHFGKHVSGTFQKGGQLSEHDSRLPAEIGTKRPPQRAVPSPASFAEEDGERKGGAFKGVGQTPRGLRSEHRKERKEREGRKGAATKLR